MPHAFAGRLYEHRALLLKEIAEPLRACHGTQLGHLSEEELMQLRALLKKLREPHEDPTSIWR